MGRLLKKFFGRNDDNADSGIKRFCQAEWGKDWYFAYTSYKKDGRFPYHVRKGVY